MARCTKPDTLQRKNSEESNQEPEVFQRKCDIENKLGQEQLWDED